jgi:LuxR family transcriptional regulator, maltose regulon positive regulatory protein
VASTAKRKTRSEETGPVLLATKLHPPAHRGDVVPRPSLLGRLSDGLSNKLTLVDAPAGWGKTTLLGQWREQEPAPVAFAWVSLDDADNDPVRFWAYAVEALRTVEPGLGADALALLRNPGTSILEVVLPTLINETARLSERVVLVLDDYHVVRTAEIHDAVAFLLEHLPPALHLVLSGRSDPPLPLPRLRARGELVEIRAQELRFTTEEAAALLNDVLGLGLDPSDVARLQQRAEGWAAGLYLAALSLRGRADAHGFIEAFAGDERHLVDYLAAEVLDQQPEAIRGFLLHTSILERLCGPLCDTVTDSEGSAATLEEIERSNLFLVPLDTKRHWYRYHRLFGQLLAHELELREPGLAPTLHRRASAWHQNEGTAQEAVHHTLAAGDLEDAGELIARHWNAFFNEGRLATVAGWLDALGPEGVRRDPRLCVARAWIALDLGHLDDVAAWIEASSHGTPPGPMEDGTASLASAITILQAVHGFKIGDLGRASESARRALDLEPDGTRFGRVVAHILVGVTLYWSGNQLEAKEALGEAAELARRAGNKLGAIYALGYLAFLHAELGELDEADALTAEAASLADDPGRAEHFVTMMVHLVRGKLYRERGQAAEAEEAIARAAELSRRGAGLLEIAWAQLTLAQVRHGRGEAREAGALLREARHLAETCPDPGALGEMLSAAEKDLRVVPRTQARRSFSPGEDISDRELDVLRLMPTRLSQREIGSSLYVSLNTVKTHTKSIFRKLGVSSREEAVTRARELGLL